MGALKSEQARKNVLGCGAPTDIFLDFCDRDLNGATHTHTNEEDEEEEGRMR